jgi:hypothetical protein
MQNKSRFRVCGQSLTEFYRTIICLASRGELPRINFISRRTPTYETKKKRRRRQSLVHGNYSSIAMCQTKIPAILRGIFEFSYLFIPRFIVEPKMLFCGTVLGRVIWSIKGSNGCMVKDNDFHTLSTNQDTWISLRSVWVEAIKILLRYYSAQQQNY